MKNYLYIQGEIFINDITILRNLSGYMYKNIVWLITLQTKTNISSVRLIINMCQYI
jgi:DNA phosphorothioation-dependent restriction protein DptG